LGINTAVREAQEKKCSFNLSIFHKGGGGSGQIQNLDFWVEKGGGGFDQIQKFLGIFPPKLLVKYDTKNAPKFAEKN
jgi:hypothetical protein